MDGLRNNREMLYAFLVFAGGFLVDIVTPLGYIDWVVYMVPLIFPRSSHQVMIIPAVGSLLIVLGFFFSPEGIASHISLIDRTLGIVVVWFVGMLVRGRLRTEEALRESGMRYRLLFDTMPAGVIYRDAGGKIIAINPAAGQILGKSLDLFSAENPAGGRRGIIREDGSPFPWMEQPFMAALKTGRMVKDTVMGVFDSAKEEYRWIRSSAVPLFKEGEEKVSQVYTVFSDITESKKAEEVLARDRVELAHLVEERSRKLLESQRELDRARRLSDLGTLAATVAHELRNPLAVIRMAGSNIRRKVREPSIEGNLENIEKKVDQGEQIIDDLLFYSRLKAPRKRETDFYEMLRESVQTAQSRFPGRDVEVRLEADGVKGLVVRADREQLAVVFNNLLNNSFEAIEESTHGKITVRAFADKDGSLVVLVKDNGIGISKDNFDRIFEPFFSTKSGGTGLGLSVVHQILKMHQGTITFESEAGKGTTAVVRLPAGQ